MRVRVRSGIRVRPMPKRGLAPIPKSDDGGCIEDIHVLNGARITIARPNLLRVRPLKPRPSQPRSRSKLVHVQNTKATQGLWPTNGFPIHLALGPGGRFLCRPKKSSLHLIDKFQSPQWDGKRP
jgi:hypothetical protein